MHGCECERLTLIIFVISESIVGSNRWNMTSSSLTPAIGVMNVRGLETVFCWTFMQVLRRLVSNCLISNWHILNSFKSMAVLCWAADELQQYLEHLKKNILESWEWHFFKKTNPKYFKQKSKITIILILLASKMKRQYNTLRVFTPYSADTLLSQKIASSCCICHSLSITFGFTDPVTQHCKVIFPPTSGSQLCKSGVWICTMWSHTLGERWDNVTWVSCWNSW